MFFKKLLNQYHEFKVINVSWSDHVPSVEHGAIWRIRLPNSLKSITICDALYLDCDLYFVEDCPAWHPT